MIGAVIDGCPPGLEISEEQIQIELDRRRPGQSAITSPRKESDIVQLVSGVFEGRSTGTPIALLAKNEDQRSADYENLKDIYRPSHADLTYQQKYGIRDWRGGGRSSARETWSRVAAGAVAKLLLQKSGIECLACVESVGELRAEIAEASLSRERIDSNPVRCPDTETAAKMQTLIQEVAAEGDSLGGIIFGLIRNIPAGLGEPVFDKFSAELGKAMLSINAVKGFEIGCGFAATKMRGSQHNDAIVNTNNKIHTATNRAGGVLGGITNGESVYFRVAFKPVSTVRAPQRTVDSTGAEVELEASGRHDACVLPRAVPIVEAMSALVTADFLLRQRAALAG